VEDLYTLYSRMVLGGFACMVLGLVATILGPIFAMYYQIIGVLLIVLGELISLTALLLRQRHVRQLYEKWILQRLGDIETRLQHIQMHLENRQH
jgi:uncharacterized membrane protein